MKTVLKYVKPYLPTVVFCVLLKTLAAFTELAIPRMLAKIIDESVPAKDMDSVLLNGGIMIMFAILTLILNLCGNRISAVASGKIAFDLREDLFDKTVRLDTSATDKIGLSSLTSRLTSDTYNITHFLTRLMRVGLKAPLMLIGGVVITLTIDTRLALVLICTLPLVCFTVYGITSRTIPLYREEQQILDSLVRRVDETHSGIRVIKALSKTEYEKDKFHKTSTALSKKEIEAGMLMSATKPITDLLLNLGFCFVILVGAFLAKRDGFDAAGALLAFMTYFTIILNNMIMMTRIFVQMSRSFASAGRVEEILLASSEMPLCDIEKKEDEPYIVFDNVSFSYNKKIPNVENLSFSVKKGSTLGIIGATGAGKSTILNLLMRLYDVDQGSVRIDGKDVRSIPKSELHSMFGVALQNDFIFGGSIEDNVSFFREGDLDSALSIACADGFVNALEDKGAHILTGKGTNVSGGQRQRLLVARAVYGSPEILILDDSSSALDYKTDFELRRNINKEVRSTTIIVAQRISSIKNADHILVIDDGRIIGSGTHDHLMQTCREYKDIAAVQMGGVEE